MSLTGVVCPWLSVNTASFTSVFVVFNVVVVPLTVKSPEIVASPVTLKS